MVHLGWQNVEVLAVVLGRYRSISPAHEPMDTPHPGVAIAPGEVRYHNGGVALERTEGEQVVPFGVVRSRAGWMRVRLAQKHDPILREGADHLCVRFA